MVREVVLYHDRITEDPRIMVGKPVVKGTRIPVELVLEELAPNPDLNELFAAHPPPLANGHRNKTAEEESEAEHEQNNGRAHEACLMSGHEEIDRSHRRDLGDAGASHPGRSAGV